MMMPEEFKYYVVELSEGLLKRLDKYVCIPVSWLKFRETADGEVLIKYPSEKKSITKRRVINEEESLDDWPIYSAEIKLGTNFYKEAAKCIKILKKISQQQESRKIVESVPSGSQNFETNVQSVQTISALLSDNVNPVSNQTLEHESTKEGSEEFQEDTEVRDSSQESTGSKEFQEDTKVRDSSPKAKIYFTRQSSRISSSANTDSVDQPVEISLPGTSSSDKESDTTDQEQDSVKSCEEYTDDFILREALREVLGDDYKEKVSMLYAECRKRYAMFKLLCHETLEHCKVFKDLERISNGNDDVQEMTPN